MKDLKSILDRLLEKTPNFKENQRKTLILEAWPRVVGEKVARHAWPICLLEGNVLLVGVESSAWMHSMRYLEGQIVEKYAKELAKSGCTVKGIRFKLETRPRLPST